MTQIPSTPFSLLFSIYNVPEQVVIKINPLFKIDLANQYKCLRYKQINNVNDLQQIVNKLIQNESNVIKSLLEKPFLRIHLKCVLSKYYSHIKSLSSSNISSWTPCDLLISFISHIINTSISNVNSTILWDFIDHLRTYFRKNDFDGISFLSSIRQETDDKTSGSDIIQTIMSDHKVKYASYVIAYLQKQYNTWATNIYQTDNFQKQTETSKNEKINPYKFNIFSFLFALFCTGQKPLTIDGIDNL
eukprot:143601_1